MTMTPFDRRREARGPLPHRRPLFPAARAGRLAALLCFSALLGACSFADEILLPTLVGDPVGGGEAGGVALQSVSAADAAAFSGLVDRSIAEIEFGASPDAGRLEAARGRLVALQDRAVQRAVQISQIEQTAALDTAAYHGTAAAIEARLQVGSEPANPALQDQWARAEEELDAVARDANAMASLAGEIAGDRSEAAALLEETGMLAASAGDVTGASPGPAPAERLRAEAANVLGLFDGMIAELQQSAERQSASVTAERADLNVLRQAIARGSLDGNGRALAALGPAAGPTVAGAEPERTPLVVIRFTRPDVAFEEPLAAAVRETLGRRPEASFSVVAVAPAGLTAAGVSSAQSRSRASAETVYRSLARLGVPAERIDLSATTSAAVVDNEVRVFVR